MTTTTYSDQVKTAQEQALKTIYETQHAVVEAVRTWADTVEKIVPAAPAVSVPFAEEIPTPLEIVHTSFDFAEQLLKAQREFTENVLAAAAPVAEKASPVAEKASPVAEKKA